MHGPAFLFPGSPGSRSDSPLRQATSAFCARPRLYPRSAPTLLRRAQRRNCPRCAESNGSDHDPRALLGQTVEVVVQRTMAYGVFVDLITGGKRLSGLIHISELASRYVSNVEDIVRVGETLMVKVISVDERGRISLSAKQAELTGYARTVQLGGDWGHPWGDDGETRWADLGPRSRNTHQPWEVDPRLFTFDWSPESLMKTREELRSQHIEGEKQEDA
jgi:hypothetical protein